VRKRDSRKAGPKAVGPGKDGIMMIRENSAQPKSSQPNPPQPIDAAGSSFGVVRQIRCDGHACDRPAVLRLDYHIFCLDHLVAHCLDRLEGCQREICRNMVPSAEALTSNNCFLEQCTSRVAGFLMARSDLSNMDRARLLDVLLWAAEIDARYIGSQPACRAVAKCAGSR
jgi:hypothetical protein